MAIAGSSASPDFKPFKPKTIIFEPGQVQKFVTVSFYANTTPQAERVLQFTGLAGSATIVDDD